MSKKQELSKLALAALLLAAASPTAIEAAAEFDAQPGIFLARGCGAKCASLSPREEIADNSPNQDSPYNAKHNAYEMKKSDKPTESSKGPSHPSEETKSSTVDSKGRYYYFTTDEESQQILPSHQKPVETPKKPGVPDDEGKSAYGARQPNQADRNSPIAEGRGPTNAARSSSYYNSYNVNRGGGDTTPTYIDSYPSNPGPNSQMRRNLDNNANLNRQYNTVNDYDYNRAVATTVNSSQTMNEAQLLGALNPQGRAMYLSLDPEGKALAIQLASEDSYKDKNLAIKEAQRRMNDRFGIINR
jgi:hypothetical protein